MIVRNSLLVFSLLALSSIVHAEKISDVANTQHNLSMTWGDGTVTDTRTVKATDESQICVFCHTPHAANSAPAAPLWNRKLEGDNGYSATYTMYDSSSMEANKPSAPTNSSKLCLSCHDGVIAIGAVNVLNGSASTIAMNGTNNGFMPNGDTGASSGNTRNIGVDLTNDHPISITYDSALATNDGELSDPLSSPHIGVRGPGVNPLIPLIPDPLDGNKPKLECVSCHDPHIRDTAGTDIKFLRLNRFQENTGPAVKSGKPTFMEFNENNDIICLACHNKEGWVDSAHANEFVADEVYNPDAALARDFPYPIQVWEAACLNCHDTHTVTGSRRLLREGTDDIPASGILKTGGGGSAIEETCYQCHSDEFYAYNVLEGDVSSVPDIRSDYQLAIRMPITTADQLAGEEVHDIGNTVDGNSDQEMGAGKDMIESQATLGLGNLNNRHAECTDCHNPHRVTKNRLANTDPFNPDAAGTHDHNLESAATHSNLISGVLRGTWGVEPIYGSTAFSSSPMAFTVKKGVPPSGIGALDSVSETYVTREYQICLKCHSNYAFSDLDPPALGHNGGTTPGTNGMTHYTNQAMEFQAPISHMGEGTALNSGSAAFNVGVGYVYGYFIAPSAYQYTDYTLAAGDCNGTNPEHSCVCTIQGSMTPDTLNAEHGFDVSTTSSYFSMFLDPAVPAEVSMYAAPPLGNMVGAIWDGTSFGYMLYRCEKTSDFSENNHRSWHPVMNDTGRDTVTRGNMDVNNFTAPFNAAVGSQTMYCSDCHGSATELGTVEPTGGENANPWGPHGSNNDFLLKGAWTNERHNNATGDVNDTNLLCFRCHLRAAYASSSNPWNTIYTSGFSANEDADTTAWGGPFAGTEAKRNLHQGHFQELANTQRGFKCTFCHTAVPHGWKNKALLVNLNDVGPEAGLPVGTPIMDTIYNPADPYRRYTTGYTKAPYYLDARLRITNFKTSGNWLPEDCGGNQWMRQSCLNMP